LPDKLTNLALKINLEKNGAEFEKKLIEAFDSKHKLQDKIK